LKTTKGFIKKAVKKVFEPPFFDEAFVSSLFLASITRIRLFVEIAKQEKVER
jgi:hypothetical protein